MSLLSVPVVRSASGGAALNRALFSKKIGLAAATVKDAKNIGKYRQALQSGGEILRAERLSAVAPDPDKDLAARGRKCLLLRPGTRADGGFRLFCVGFEDSHLADGNN